MLISGTLWLIFSLIATYTYNYHYMNQFAAFCAILSMILGLSFYFVVFDTYLKQRKLNEKDDW